MYIYGSDNYLSRGYWRADKKIVSTGWFIEKKRGLVKSLLGDESRVFWISFSSN
jgi:hypothetical protein